MKPAPINWALWVGRASSATGQDVVVDDPSNEKQRQYLSGEQAVEAAKMYLEKNYARAFTLKDLAELTGFDKYYLRSLFKNRIGRSPHVYQKELKLTHATNLLEQGMSAAEVASRVGFADQSHLNRAFRKQFGMTVGEYQHLNVKP